MPNRIRGDSELVAGNQHYTMRLTLGALAEIEDALGLTSLGDIAARLKTLATSDIAAVASALLRGGGHTLSASDVLKFECDLGSIVRAIAAAFTAAGLDKASEDNAPGYCASSAPPREIPLAGAASSNSP